MRVAELLTEHSLKLTLETATDTERLNQELTRCALTEHLDPTPFLDPGVLLLTAGIGMNFTEQSIWDGYVERLDRAAVSAVGFAVGTAHPELPVALARACTRFNMPLLKIPAMVPLLKIEQHVEGLLQAERFARAERGWALADECARLASQGAEISTLLAAIYTAVELPIAVYDGFNSLIAQYPEGVTWQPRRDPAAKSTDLGITLPMGLSSPCKLVVRRFGEPIDLQSILTPVASILALQINRSVVVDSSSHQEMQRFVRHCVSWSESTRTEVVHAFHELEFPASNDTWIMVADISGEHGAAAWRFRVALHDAFHEVRITESDHLLIALAQLPRLEQQDVITQFLRFHPTIPLVLRPPTQSVDQLRIALVHALDHVKHTEVPVVAPALGLSAVVAAAAGRGAREAAETFMKPLLEQEDSGKTELLLTLQTWLQHDAQPSRTCEALFIHRNSLSYRLRRIEELLGISLAALDGRATCLMALRLIDIEPY